MVFGAFVPADYLGLLCQLASVKIEPRAYVQLNTASAVQKSGATAGYK